MKRDEILVMLDMAQQHLLQGVTDKELVAHLERCLTASTDLYDQELEARTRSYLSGYHQLAGERSLAREHAVRGLDLVRGTRTELEVDLLIQVARLKLAHDAATALAYTQEAFEISTTLHGEAKPHVMLRYGEALGATGNFAEAIRLMRRADENYEIRSDLHGRSNVLQRLCVLLIHSEHYALTVEYAHEVFEIASELGLPLVQINALKFLAIALTKINRLESAYEVARRALDLCDRVQDTHLKADLHGVLGDVYLDLNDHRAALELFTTALQEYRQRGFVNGEAIALSRIAETYARAGEFVQADVLFSKATDLAMQIHNVAIHRSIVIVQAGMYMRMNMQNKAEQILATVDFSLPNLEATAPSDAMIQRAIQTFRRVTAETTRIDLPALDDLLNDEHRISTARPVVAPRPGIELTSPGIVVSMLGSFAVHRHGHMITMEEWKRKKARDIFKILAIHHQKPVTIDELVAKIWGEDTIVDTCVPTLQNAISSIRLALEPTLKPRQPSSYIIFRDGTYTLDLGTSGYTDVDRFRGLIHAAFQTSDRKERRSLLTEGIDWYKGDLLPDDTYASWTDYVRDELRQEYSDALDALAAVCFELGDPEAAKAIMRRAALLEDQ